jgi:hypothetical protein
MTLQSRGHRKEIAMSVFTIRRSSALRLIALPLLLVAAFSQVQSATPKETELRNAMRKLWEDHITWTRLFIVSAAADLPDKEATTQRLLQNQADIGNAIKPFYGDAGGDRLAELLRDHILIAADVVGAAKAQDNAKKDEAAQRWSANADQIAEFLSDSNPKNWPVDEMKKMMQEHLDLTMQEAVARLQGDWAADIAAYEKVHEQILKMADGLSEGIIKEFPKKFK